ncbi:hypothetical protein [Haemophilus pittmaniae]|uniref:hypothetical protein n=1 Tax=Haemophilus pittmaniae TaxID=249188 RepID=UPI0028DD1B42|nr:hypothetical protein [Haemophilus pittmaniae]
MKTLYFCSHDGNPRKVYKSDALANEWEEQGGLYFVTSVQYDDNNQIVCINDDDLDDFVESIADEKGTPEFERVKSNIVQDFKFTEITDD